MSFRPRSYPHPVLSPFSRDYVDDSQLFGTFERRSEGGELVIDYEVTLTSSRLNEFRAPDTGDFQSLDIYSKGSRWRKFFRIANDKGSLAIPESHIFGTVEVTPMLLAAKDGELDFSGINREYSSS